MNQGENSKNYRILSIYAKLISGEVVDVDKLSCDYNVDHNSIQQDITTIRSFMKNEKELCNSQHIVSNQKHSRYVISCPKKAQLNNREIMEICECMLENSFTVREDHLSILYKLVGMHVPKHKREKILTLIEKKVLRHTIDSRLDYVSRRKY